MTPLRQRWNCTDTSRPEPYRDGTETTFIESDEHLILLLNEYIVQKPRILCLEREDGAIVFVGIGNHFGALTFHVNASDHVGKCATPRETVTNVEQWFICNGEPSEFKARFLMPTDLLVVVVRTLIVTGEFSDDVNWE